MLILKNITKTYRSKRGGECLALKNVSLSFGDKGLIFVCGKSGSGKSTLLNIASGMDGADEGELIIDGKSSDNFKQSDFDVYRNTYAGYIFQDFGLIDELNVRENISLSVELQGAPPTAEQIEEALKSVGLDGYGERKSFELSGGQRQRVSIARALIKNPKIVFADEPTGNLDAACGKQIFELFKELSKTRLVVIISHDADSAVYYGDRVITLSDGEVVSDLVKTGEVDIDEAKAEYQRKIDKAFSPFDGEEKRDGERFTATQNHFPFLRAAKIGVSNFNAKKTRFIFMLLLSVIALTTFCLADTMRNFNPYTAAVNTFRDLDIDSVLLVNNRLEYDESGVEIRIPVEFASSDIDKISQKYASPYTSYAIGCAIAPYNANTSEKHKIYKNEIGSIVQTADEFNAGTLSGFYGSTLIYGKYPVKNSEEIEVLISDCLADSIMFYGGRFVGEDVIPNEGYDKIMNKHIDYNGLIIKIVGIFDTDYEAVSREEGEERSLKYRFNYTNFYSVALTVKDAVLDCAMQNESVPISGYFTFSGGDFTNLNLIVTAKEKASDFFGVLPISVIYKDGYDRNTVLTDNELIIGKSFLDELLQNAEQGYNSDYEFENVTTADFTNLNFSIILIDPSRTDSIDGLKVVGVFDDSVNSQLVGVALANADTKNRFIKGSLIVTNCYLSLDKSKKENRELLEYLDGQNIQYLSYASTELDTISSLFKLLSQILGGVSGILFVFVLLLLFNFISSSVVSKQKEIGILRAMGARGIDTAKIFIIEGAALFVISLALAVIFSIIGTIVLNASLTSSFANTITVLSLNFTTFVLAAAGNAVAIFLASLFPLIKITRMKPIDAVKIAGA
jgi:ABC-type lipoprotein export system ATPase subunit/ABC-type antimicrobial peptide transport system permease subunit